MHYEQYLERRRQINLMLLNTTITILKGPVLSGHSLLRQSGSKNLSQSIRNVPYLGCVSKPGQLWNSLWQERTEDIFQRLDGIVMITVYVKTKRLKMQFLFGEKGIGRRRLRRLSLYGTNACTRTYTETQLIRGSALQNTNILVL